MTWRRLWPWLLVLGVALWFGWRTLRRQTAAVPAAAAAARPAPAPPATTAEPVNLLEHDGAAIDFSSGRPVVKNTPADRAAVAREVQAMDAATKDVTFQPVTAPATQTQAAPPPPAPPAKP